MTGRVLFYVQHLLGIGHLKRAAILARAMAAESLQVTVAFGGIPLPAIDFDGAQVVRLPAATIANEDFSSLLDEHGQPVDEAWKTRRRDALLDLLRETIPDVVLIELFPFGRRQFDFELLPLLEACRQATTPPRAACSVRDILVATKKAGRDAETVATLRRLFDAVLVHGDPDLIPFGATFAAAGEIADLIHHTGYVAEGTTAAETREGEGEVLVSAGGGAVGSALLFAALAARPLTPLADRIWRFLTGPNLSDAEFERLAASASDRIIVERFRSDFPGRLRNAALSISQAGYNTTMDILSAGVRAVVVPYESPGETEQRLRAEILAEKGLLTVLPEAELSPTRLAAAIDSALALRRTPARVDLSGAATTARIVQKLSMR